jgi:hypothetical protein
MVNMLPVSCERSSRFMPAGLPTTVEASCASAANIASVLNFIGFIVVAPFASGLRGHRGVIVWAHEIDGSF